jgi:hypothetical protein
MLHQRFGAKIPALPIKQETIDGNTNRFAGSTWKGL